MGFLINPYVFDKSLIDIITDLGLTTGLQVVLDAGDENSYTSGQPWLDLSGNGFDFNRGLTNTPATDDPTFNGVAGGISSNEYFSSDGADAFNYDSANETFMANLHLDGAKFAVFDVSWLIAAAGNPVCGTRAISAGIEYTANSSARPLITVNGGSVLTVVGDTALDTSAWSAKALVLDENGGAVSFFWNNGNYNQVSASNTFDANYTSPTGTASRMAIGSGGANGTASFNGFMANGQRIGCFAMWSGTIPTKADLDNIFTEIRGRFGL